MTRLSRLGQLEKRYGPPEQMLGSIEVHCVGGWPHLDGGRECSEHERCAFSFTPLPGRLRRMIMVDWHEGMGNPFTPQ